MVVVLVWLVVLLWQANALESFFFLKEGTVLNSLNTVAQYESEYDEDLYLLKSTSCPWTKPSDVKVKECEHTCDYATKSSCGTTKFANCYCSEEKKQELCGGAKNIEVGVPLRIRQNVPVQDFRVFLPEYRPYEVHISGNTLGTLINVGNEYVAHTTPFSMAFAQNPHWAADMMWTSLYSFNDSDIADKPVVHLCPSCKEFVTGTWFIQSLCWGQPICDYEILVRELPEIPSIAPQTCNGQILPAGYTCIEAGVEQEFSFNTNKEPIYLVYYPPMDSCPYLFTLYAKTFVYSYARVEMSFENFRNGDVETFWDTQTEVGSVWSALSFDCASPRRIFIRLTLDWTLQPSVPVQLIVHTQPEAFYAERAADMFAIDYSFNAAGSSKLVCPGKTIAECGSRMLTIASDFNLEPSDKTVSPNYDYSAFDCSRAVNHPKPARFADIETTNPFWPPFGVSNFKSAYMIDNYPDFKTDPKKHVFSLLIRSITAKTQVDYYDTDMLSSCRLEMTGRLVYKNLTHVPSPPAAKKRAFDLPHEGTSHREMTLGDCDIDRIEEISVLLAFYRQGMAHKETLGEVYLSSILADAISFSQDWINCFAWLNEHMNDQEISEILKRVPNPLGLLPQEDTISYTGNINTLNAERAAKALAQCDSGCAASFMEELNIYKAEDKCPFFSLTFDEYMLDNSRFLESCIRNVWRPDHGDMRTSLFCLVDAQCPEKKCNVFTHTCVVQDMSVYNDNVLKCIRDSAPDWILGQLLPGFSDYTAGEQLDLLKGIYVEPGCQPVENWDASWYNAFQMGLMCDDQCGSATTGDVPISLIPTPTRLSDICKRSACALPLKFAPYANKNCQAHVCNKEGVGSGLEGDALTQACNNTAPFCGVCESKASCKELPGSTLGQTECEETTICVAHDGRLINNPSITKQECFDKYGACYVDSPRKYEILPQSASDPNFNRNDCVQSSLQVELDWYTRQPGFAGVGLCYFPQAPPAVPCNRYGGIPIQSGCIILTFTTQADCERFVAENIEWHEGKKVVTIGVSQPDPNFQVLNAYHGSWIPKEKIAFYNAVYNCVLGYHDYWNIYSSWSLPKNRDDCLNAGGKFVLAFKTLGTQWVPGTLRTGKWVKPQVVEVAKTENVLNYQKFSTDLNLALSKLYFVDESAPSICRLESPISSLRNLLRQCEEGCTIEDDKEHSCPIDYAVYLSRATFCSGIIKSVPAFPIEITSSSETINSGGCEEISIYIISKYRYPYIVIPVFTSPFYIPTQRGDYSYPYVALNRNEAVIGDVVSDGVMFKSSIFGLEGSEGQEVLKQMELCITATSPIDSFEYHHLDFAVLDRRQKIIRPLGLGYREGNSTSNGIGPNGTTFCAVLDIEIGETYFLVNIREDDWDSEDLEYLYTGEQAYFLAVAGIYFVVFVLYLYPIYESRNKVVFPICIALAINLGWRCIHLLVVGASSGTISSPFLSEPPFFFYMEAVMMTAAFYHAVTIATLKPRQQKKIFREESAIAGIILGSICIVICVIATTQTVTTENAHAFSCYQRVDEGDIYWTDPQIISVAYFCSFLLMSLLISFYTLHKSFGIVNHGRSVKKLMGIQKTSVKYIRIAMILTSAMVVQAILILTLGLIGGTRDNMWLRLTTLAFFELLPAIGFLVINQKEHLRKLFGISVSSGTESEGTSTGSNSKSQKTAANDK